MPPFPVAAVLALVLFQAPSPMPSAPGVPGACEAPADAHAGKHGCYFVAATDLGVLPATSVFWHLYEYKSRADADAAVGARGTVVHSHGRTWVYTIATEDWRPASGRRVDVIGPLVVSPDKSYTARYMEATFPPGMRTRAHRHSGAEAWYLLTGTQCLETPEGITVLEAGESAVVPQGPPMVLSSVGSETRRSVLLVLHESDEPWTSPAADWQPAGKCPK